ncbi:MAG TPA: Amuc_1100 family pilus-like protein [Opitutaceae bacterium]|nr:Amuc_1100 family pilus-like protein [Opitutaceae bacterium]
MNSLRNHPLFGGALILLGALCIAEIAFALKFRREAVEAGQLLEARRAELAGTAMLRPFPSPENAAALEAHLESSQRVVAAMRASLRGSPVRASAILSAPPASRTDAFFDLARFVERNRERANSAGVAIRADERFGFSLYANEGPEPDLIPAVHRQKAIVDFLLGVLFDARLRELVSVQREVARIPGQEGRAEIVEVAPQNDATFFSVDPRVTARVPGFVDSTGFRITFVGQTGALRDFLNRIAAFELPVIVRSVEIEPMPEPQRAQGSAVAAPSLASVFGSPAQQPGTPSAATGPVPIVSQNLSRFTVTIEFIELVAPPTPAA